MIITPARFEDEYNSIKNGNDTQMNKFLKIFALMRNTLESLGYEAAFKYSEDNHDMDGGDLDDDGTGATFERDL